MVVMLVRRRWLVESTQYARRRSKAVCGWGVVIKVVEGVQRGHKRPEAADGSEVR
jgi:hypothetical protein